MYKVIVLLYRLFSAKRFEKGLSKQAEHIFGYEELIFKHHNPNDPERAFQLNHGGFKHPMAEIGIGYYDPIRDEFWLYTRGKERNIPMRIWVSGYWTIETLTVAKILRGAIEASTESHQPYHGYPPNYWPERINH